MKLGVLVPAILSILAASIVTAAADYSNDCSEKDGDAAIRACTRVIKSGRWHGKNLAWAYNNRGLSYVDKGKHKRAFSDYRRALKLDRRYFHSFRNRGKLHFKIGNLDNALRDFRSALRVKPGWIVALNDRAHTYMRMGKYDEAMGDLSKSILIDPARYRTFELRGRLHRILGHPQEALGDFTRANAINSRIDIPKELVRFGERKMQ